MLPFKAGCAHSHHHTLGRPLNTSLRSLPFHGKQPAYSSTGAGSLVSDAIALCPAMQVSQCCGRSRPPRGEGAADGANI